MNIEISREELRRTLIDYAKDIIEECRQVALNQTYEDTIKWPLVCTDIARKIEALKGLAEKTFEGKEGEENEDRSV